MPTWIRSSGLEIDVLTIDETHLEPMVTVEVIGTGEIKEVPIGGLVSSEGDVQVYQQADKIIQDDSDR